ncbi:MAG: sigma-E processing peptidase SpoIIGA [Firmicutes bacterium]|nr:sigma-E processing peptidase SpoIIGA [Bacillota bacterium]MDD4693431.1 sigma-E processing peptidase SpoIIGA [Bacillota bacterium]
MSFVVYVDLLIACLAAEFWRDYLILWAGGEIANREARPGGLFLGAILGSLYYLGFLLLTKGDFSLSPAILATLSLIMPALMVLLAFNKIDLKAVLPMVYLLALVAGGIGFWLQSMNVARIWVLLGPHIAVLLIAEIGWGLLHERFWESFGQIALVVEIGGHKQVFRALIDSGNELVEPVSGKRVVIVEKEVLKSLVPEDIMRSMEQMTPILVDSESTENWGRRLVLIPFKSVGKDNGVLVGLRPDSVYLKHKGKQVKLPGVIIGLENNALSQKGEYQALIHPALLMVKTGGEQREMA